MNNKRKISPHPPIDSYQRIPVRKNDDITLKIERLGSEGEGIGHVDGFTIMVPGALPGETVGCHVLTVRPRYAAGKLMEIQKTTNEVKENDTQSHFASGPSFNASKTEFQRVTPECPLFGKCGGCQLQHMSYEAQLRFKTSKVREDLRRIGHFTEEELSAVRFEDTLGCPEEYHYRNKAQFPIREVNGQTEAGFFRLKSHALLPVHDCRIQTQAANDLIEKIVLLARKLNLSPYEEENGKGLLRHVLIRQTLHEGASQLSVLFVLNADSLPEESLWISQLQEWGVTSFSLNVNKRRDNVILGAQTVTLFGEPYVLADIGALTYKVAPTAFLQVNTPMTKVLYDKVKDFLALTPEETLWDIYCGAGTIGLYLASAARAVYGVEVVPEAIENARENAALNGITNAEFFVGKAEEVFPEKLRQGLVADAVVLDPPRGGCRPELLKALLAMQPAKIVYVSCEPSTLARDLHVLCHEGTDISTSMDHFLGYTLSAVCPADLFPQTSGVETVVLLNRK